MQKKAYGKTYSLAIAAGLVFISGCGNGSVTKEGAAPTTTAPTSATAPTATAAPKPAENIKLTFYSYNPYPQADFDNLWGNLIREKFPNIDPVYLHTDNKSNIHNLIAAGQQVDIMFDSIGTFNEEIVQTGSNMDMTDLAKKAKIDLSKFEPTLVDAMKELSGGKMYGLPISNNTMVLFYNKDIFDKFGVAYPKDGMTWDEAIAVGNKLTRKEGDVDYLGLALSQSHALGLNQFSTPLVDPKTDKPTILTDPSWKAIFDTYILGPTTGSVYKDFIKQNKNKVPFQNEFTKTKNLAMFGMVANMMGDPVLNDMNWDMVSMPVFKEKPGVGMQAYPNYISVTAKSTHKDEAMQVISYLLSDEVQRKRARMGDIPALKDPAIRKEFGQDKSYKNKNLLGALFTNSFAPIAQRTLYDSAINSIYRSPTVNVIMGNLDLNSMFRQANDAAEKKIEDTKKK